MKNSLQTLLVAAIMAFTNTNVKAQYVTIPDPVFANYISTYYPNCMNGNMLDTTCLFVNEVFYMSLWDGSYTDLTGIKYFKNLSSLSIRNHQLVSLPELPTLLTSLECTNGPLINLPTLPSALKFLEISQNPISSLPTLPASLITLSCENTLLTSLPELPQSLVNIYAGFTKLTSLPALPSLLEVLYCNDGELTGLPEIPSTLGVIYCPNNKIESLPTIPASLSQLYCSFNKITSITETLAAYHVELAFNQLTSLPPTIAESVYYLDVSNNPNLNCVPDIKNETMFFYWEGTNIQCIPYGLIRADNYSIPELNDLPSCISSNLNECSFTQLDNCPVVKNYNSTLETNGYTLSWTPPSGSTKCEISGGIYNKRKFSKIINGTLPLSIFISENLLRANTLYEWKVRCNCETKNEFDDFFYGADYFTTGTDLDFGFPKSNNQEQNIFIDESNIVTNSTNNTTVFPNPAMGNFVIQSDLKNYNLQVTDVTGKLVYSQNNVTETSLSLDIKNIEAGTYFVNITNENAKEVIKLMVY
jgi:Leucine-rich repeat (LRR) protein